MTLEFYLVVLGMLALEDRAGRRTMETHEADSVHRPIRSGRGSSDVLARSIASIIQGAGTLNPTPLIVNNQAGGSSTVGTTAVAQSPGNEHMLLTFISGQVAAPLAAGKGAATYHDLTLIAGFGDR